MQKPKSLTINPANLSYLNRRMDFSPVQNHLPCFEDLGMKTKFTAMNAMSEEMENTKDVSANYADHSLDNRSLEVLNPGSSIYRVPTEENDKGELQKYMEDQTRIDPMIQQSFTYMLVLTQFDFWQADRKEPYLTYNSEDFKKTKPRSWRNLKVTKKLLETEIRRRNPSFKSNFKNTTVVGLLEKLSAPKLALVDKRDLDFLRFKEREMRSLLSECIEQFGKRQPTSLNNKAIPHTRKDRMRLICCFQFESIADAYRKSQVPMTRAQLEVRKSDILRGETFEDLIIAQFNDQNWVARSIVIVGLHEDFAKEHDYPFREEYHLDKTKLKNIFAWEKYRIMEMIRKYDESGRGSVNADDIYQQLDDDESVTGQESNDVFVHKKYGHFDRSKSLTKGGDDRSDFLNGKPTDLLYWWHILDSLDMISMLCCMFKTDLGGSSLASPSIASEKQDGDNTERKKKDQDDKLTQTMEQQKHATATLATSIDKLVNNLNEGRSNDLKREAYELKREIIRLDSDESDLSVLIHERLREVEELIRVCSNKRSKHNEE